VCKAAKQRLPFTRLHEVAALGKELGVLSDDEVELLERTEIGRLKVINVDDFEHGELMAGQAAVDYHLAQQSQKKTDAAA